MPVTIVGNNTPTAGGVVYGDGTNYASTAAGSAGQVLQSNGSSAPSWVSPSTGAMTLVSTATASSSSSIVFTNLNFSTYKEYMILLSNVVPSTNAASIGVRLSQNNGSSYPSGGFSYNYALLRMLSTYSCLFGNNASILLDNGISNVASRGGLNCNLYLNSLINTAYNSIYGMGSYEDSSQSNIGFLTQGVCYDLTAAVNAIQFIPQGGGTIASGTFKLYGIT